MTDLGMVLAHGGHGGGETIWLLIPLVVVGFLLWRSARRADKEQPPRNLGPRPKETSSEENAKHRDRVESGNQGGAE
jgi:hypothetical protein